MKGKGNDYRAKGLAKAFTFLFGCESNELRGKVNVEGVVNKTHGAATSFPLREKIWEPTKIYYTGRVET